MSTTKQPGVFLRGASDNKLREFSRRVQRALEKGGRLTIGRRKQEIILYALARAIQAPRNEALLEDLQARMSAGRDVVLSRGDRRRFRDAAIAAGWLEETLKKGRKGQQAKQPTYRDDLAVAYIALTENTGLVLVKQPTRRHRGRDDNDYRERTVLVDGCPLPPLRAVRVLAEIYDKKPETMLQGLWRLKKRLDLKWQELTGTRDLGSVSPALRAALDSAREKIGDAEYDRRLAGVMANARKAHSIPALETLPQVRAFEDEII